MLRSVAALAVCVVLAGCGAQAAGDGNPLIKQAQLVGDEAPPPNNELPVFDPDRREPPPYVDSKGPGAEARKALRQGVITTAKAFKYKPCDEEAKQAYLQAFSDYAAAKIAMQRTQMSYGVYWTTRDDKLATDTLDQFTESGHIAWSDQRQALMRATPQGRMQLAMGASTQADLEDFKDFTGEEIKPACRNPKPKTAA